MSFAAYARHHEPSRPVEPPPTREPLRDAVAPPALSAAVASAPSEPASLATHAFMASDALAGLRAPLQGGFDLFSASSPLGTTFSPFVAPAIATDRAAIAAEMAIPSPELQMPVASEDAQLPQSEAALRPAWQMEKFTWPKVCRRMFARVAEELDRFADALVEAEQCGKKVLAISGWHYGEGATTLLICAARRLAERGLRPVLVDADVERPRLARRLGVQPQTGWNQSEARFGGASVAQVIVAATVTNLALVPAWEPSGKDEPSTCDRSALVECLDSLRLHYDLVLVDLGPLENVLAGPESSSEELFQGIDAVVLVRDQRLTTPERLSDIHSQLTSAGITIPGIIENFVGR